MSVTWREEVNPNHDVLTKARKHALGGRGGRVRGILDICGDQTMCVCPFCICCVQVQLGIFFVVAPPMLRRVSGI